MASDKEEVTCPLLLDYSAAFNTVDHDILLTILEDSFGIAGTALNWIRSFLVGRYQIFQIRRDKSSRMIVLYGLPQGTIKGPLMYILYIWKVSLRNMGWGCTSTLMTLNSTTTHMWTISIGPQQLSKHASRTYVVQFSSQCRLKLNPTKTELIWMGRAHAIGKLSQQPRLSMNSNEVSSSSSVRDVGLIIDSGLTLATHVSIVARNCFYQLRRIRQAKKCLDEFRLREDFSPCSSPFMTGQ